MFNSIRKKWISILPTAINNPAVKTDIPRQTSKTLGQLCNKPQRETSKSTMGLR